MSDQEPGDDDFGLVLAKAKVVVGIIMFVGGALAIGALFAWQALHHR